MVHGGEPEPELVGAHAERRGAVGEQIELAHVDAVLHLARDAQPLLEPARLDLVPPQRGDHQAELAQAQAESMAKRRPARR